MSLSTSRTSGDFGYFSVLETPDSIVDEETIEKFRTYFAFDEKEKLLGCKYILQPPILFLNILYRLPGLYFPSATRLRPPLYLK